MKVIVCGGRDFWDGRWLSEELDRLHAQHGFSSLSHGGASGADRLAAAWANTKKVPVKGFFADWSTHGKRAGPIRNGQMLRESGAELVIAFPGGRGTRDMIDKAISAEIPVIEIQPY